MTLFARRSTRLMTFALVVSMGLLPSLTLAGQRRGGGDRGGGGHRGGGERVGTAVPRGSTGGTRAGGASEGGRSGRSTPAGDPAGSSGGDRTRSTDSGDSTGSRPRDGRPVVGRAEPREARPGGGTTVIVPGGGYYGGLGPWGYGGFGFYDGWYDPWYGGAGPWYGYAGDAFGALRLKVKPREAQVFVDGYYAGIVDQFDGVFQRLKIEPGPHRIEMSAEGYEPVMFEIRALPDQTTTYKGTLTKLP
jgi:hypothetical protein